MEIFIKRLRSVDIERYLELPNNTRTEALPFHGPGDIVIPITYGQDGVEVDVHCSIRSSRLAFTRGWIEIARNLRLNAGDVVALQREDHGRYKMTVISSCGEPLTREEEKMAGSNRDEIWKYASLQMARLKSGWTLLLTNLILEIASAVFDQLGNAFVGMVLAFVALLLAAAELIYMERMSILPLFRRPSTRTLAPGKPVGTIVEYFGLGGAVWQCFYSTVEYAYARQKRDNPIKMCLLPFIFLLCVVISKLIKKEFH